MELVRKAEAKLAELFKGAPTLQDNSQESLVKFWPWLALISGVLQLWAALAAFSWARRIDDITNSANDFFRAIGAPQAAPQRVTFWLWLGVVFLIVEGVLLLIAFPKLRERLKTGWDLLFIVGLLNVVYAVVSLFSDYRGGFFALIWNLLVTTVMFWLLFAVRGKYHSSPRARASRVAARNTDAETESSTSDKKVN